MEFDFNINHLFGSEISCIDKDCSPYRTSPMNIREYKSQLCQVLDCMGQASAKAQGLQVAITTSTRLQLSEHRVYIMKDSSACGGLGAIVGFIKTGSRRLFIYDHHGVNHEMEPLCALDFYVHESRQRMGCGRKLFEFMLREERLKPHQIAIDGPSNKFLSFLHKHYKLKATVPQVNNFVVFDGFFRDKPSNIDRRHGSKPPPAPAHPYKRQGQGSSRCTSVRTPRSIDIPSTPNRPTSGSKPPLTSIAKEKEIFSNVPLDRPQSGRNSHNGQNVLDGNSSPLAMAAKSSKYSRHTPTPPPPSDRHGVNNNNTNITNNSGCEQQRVNIDVSKKVIGGKDPPLRPRDHPSSDYQNLYRPDSYNGSSYQDRRGHLRVTPNDFQKLGVSELQRGLPPGNPYITRQAKPLTVGSTWNVFGVPPNPRAGSRYPQTGLW